MICVTKSNGHPADIAFCSPNGRHGRAPGCALDIGPRARYSGRMETIWKLVEGLEHDQWDEGGGFSGPRGSLRRGSGQAPSPDGEKAVHSYECRRCAIEVRLLDLTRLLDQRRISEAIEELGTPAAGIR